jgi:hypothetical protein
MRFRLKAFGLHVLGSACALTLVLGGLYLGWYRWPGWYLTGVISVAAIMGSVDLVLGPLLTLLVASPTKPGRVLARDIAVIVCVQLVALVYGAVTLWYSRPLYYTLYGNRLQVVQASELDRTEITAARNQNPDLAPTWYSLPRWAWAQMPEDPAARNQAIAVMRATDKSLNQMPRYFKPWTTAAAQLRSELRTPDQQYFFSSNERKELRRRMATQGMDPDRPATMPLLGHEKPLLAVFDPSTLDIRAIMRAD